MGEGEYRSPQGLYGCEVLKMSQPYKSYTFFPVVVHFPSIVPENSTTEGGVMAVTEVQTESYFQGSAIHSRELEEGFSCF